MQVVSRFLVVRAATLVVTSALFSAWLASEPGHAATSRSKNRSVVSKHRRIAHYTKRRIATRAAAKPALRAKSAFTSVAPYLRVAAAPAASEAASPVLLTQAPPALTVPAAPAPVAVPAPVATPAPVVTPVVVPASDEIITETWPLSFLATKVGTGTADDRFDVDSMISGIHSIYGQDASTPDLTKPLLKHSRHLLILHGKRSDIFAIKRLLVALESPPPTVQMDMWAIQIAGKRGKDMDERLSRVATAVKLAQKKLEVAQFLLADQIDRPLAGSFEPGLKTQLGQLGFDTDTHRALTLTEMFVFLGIADSTRREAIVTGWEKAWSGVFPNSPVVFQNMRNACGLFGDQTEWPRHVELDHKGMHTFLDALSLFRENADFANFSALSYAQKRQATPESLSRAAAIGDAQLKAVTDAFTKDMNEWVFDPMLKSLQDGSVSSGSKNPLGGIALVGKTRLVVSSGLETGLEPTLKSYVNTTMPKALTPDALKTALGGADVLKAALPGLNPEDLRALAVLFNQPEPQITELAPGLGINVRPTVMPGDDSARLQIEMHVGVETKMQAAGTNVLEWKPADAVQNHKVITDIPINGFDLFDISSFAISTSHPRPPGYIPVLGTLPWVGQIFQWRRKDTQADHHSMILVNAVILPRAKDVASFYGN